MVLSPEKLKELSQKSEKQTRDFFKKIKQKDFSKIDALANRFNKEIFDEINCLDCANCCRSLGPRLKPTDIDRLAKALRIRNAEFIDRYIIIDEDNDYVFKSMPCPFLLNDNYCSVYENRPEACREYPHLEGPKFIKKLPIALKNRYTCPAVFRVIEKIQQQWK